MELEGKLYDTVGNEIIVPEGHVIAYGAKGYCFVPVENNIETKFVYKEPSEEVKQSEKHKKLKKILGE